MSRFAGDVEPIQAPPIQRSLFFDPFAMQILLAHAARAFLHRKDPPDGAWRARVQRASKQVLLTGRQLLLAVLLLCSVMGAGWAQNLPPGVRPTSITVVMDDNYPPFIFRDSSGQLQGILKDMWALWASHTGIGVDLQAMDWGKAQAVMAAGQADVIDTIFETEPRKALYDFSAPYAKLDVPLFFHQSISGIVNVDSLKGFTVGVKNGDACVDALRREGCRQPANVHQLRGDHRCRRRR